MSNTTNDGGPAFPQPADQGNLEDWRHGMSLRDWFAGQAMQGLLADHKDHPEEAITRTVGDVSITETCQETVARLAVGYADALLKELSKQCRQ